VFGKLRQLLTRQKPPVDVVLQLKAMAHETIQKVDFESPAERVGIRLYFVLKKQFELIGKPEGEFPYVPPFSSEKSRGALLGIAISVVREEYGETPSDLVADAVETAFVLAFGKDSGRSYANYVMKEAAEGNVAINFASDWAIRNFGGDSDESDAFYLAVAEII
jgi:hypothetical protein